MAKESVNILKDKIDIVDLLAQLNAALSEEWLAFYQYWVGSFVVEGAMRGDVQREFQEHAAEEYNHAKLLADRIIELEGVPVLDTPFQFQQLESFETKLTEKIFDLPILNVQGGTYPSSKINCVIGQVMLSVWGTITFCHI